MRILYVEDSRKLREVVSAALRKSGYAVDVASDGEEALFHLENNSYDLAILDIMVPKLDGISLLTKIRSSGDQTPVLFLSAKDDIADRVKGLEMGADDYLGKPFALEELIARVGVLSRRGFTQPASKVIVGDLELDTSSKSVTRAGVPVPLSAREFEVLEILMRRAGSVVSRTTLDAHFYDDSSLPMSNVTDVIICSIRRKISLKKKLSGLIVTRRGLGYIIPDTK